MQETLWEEISPSEKCKNILKNQRKKKKSTKVPFFKNIPK